MHLLNMWYVHRSQVSSSFLTNVDKISFGKPVLYIFAGTQEKVKNQTGKEWCPQSFKYEKLYWSFFISLAVLETESKFSEWLWRNQFYHVCFGFPFCPCFFCSFTLIFFEHALSLIRNDNCSNVNRDLQLLQYEIIAGEQRPLILQSDSQVSMCNDHDSPRSRNRASKMRKAALKPNSFG